MTRKRRRGAPPQKTAQNLAKTITQYIQGKRYKPLSASELGRQLAIPEVHQTIFKEILDTFVAEGKMALQKGKYSLPTSNALATGIISIHAKGFGFVRQEGGDIFIPRHATADAVDGDEVEVEVNPVVSAKGPEGEVIAILKRSRTHLAGTITSKSGGHYLAYAPLLGIDKPVLVKAKGQPLREGDRIICKVTRWSNDSKEVEAELDRLIGHIEDPSIDIRAAIEEFEIPDGFTEESLAEARKFGTKISSKELKNRKDITDWECVTIDPDTAKDFDDAITLTKDRKGHLSSVSTSPMSPIM